VDREEKLKRCQGCDANYYNRNNNSVTGQCWHLKKAKPVTRKEVHVNDRPPWDNQPVKEVLDCYHRRYFIYVSPDARS